MRIVAVPFWFFVGGEIDGEDPDYWKRARQCLPPKSHQISSPLFVTAWHGFDSDDCAEFFGKSAKESSKIIFPHKKIKRTYIPSGARRHFQRAWQLIFHIGADQTQMIIGWRTNSLKKKRLSIVWRAIKPLWSSTFIEAKTRRELNLELLEARHFWSFEKTR